MSTDFMLYFQREIPTDDILGIMKTTYGETRLFATAEETQIQCESDTAPRLNWGSRVDSEDADDQRLSGTDLPGNPLRVRYRPRTDLFTFLGAMLKVDPHLLIASENGAMARLNEVVGQFQGGNEWLSSRCPSAIEFLAYFRYPIPTPDLCDLLTWLCGSATVERERHTGAECACFQEGFPPQRRVRLMQQPAAETHLGPKSGDRLDIRVAGHPVLVQCGSRADLLPLLKALRELDTHVVFRDGDCVAYGDDLVAGIARGDRWFLR